MAKILLVEDDNNLREIYEARLQAEGYQIVAAKDGEEALVIAKKEQPDLIISDVMMPNVSGFEMLDILRNTEGFKDIKVIMLTALGQAEDKTRADSLGADRYLVKSQVTLEDIVKAAGDLLAGVPGAPIAAPPEPVAPVAPAPAPAPAAVPTIPTATPPVEPAPAPAPVAVTPAPPMPVATPPPAVPPTAPAPVTTPSTNPTTPTPAPGPAVPAPAPAPVADATAQTAGDAIIADAVKDLLANTDTANTSPSTPAPAPAPAPPAPTPVAAPPTPEASAPLPKLTITAPAPPAVISTPPPQPTPPPEPVAAPAPPAAILTPDPDPTPVATPPEPPVVVPPPPAPEPTGPTGGNRIIQPLPSTGTVQSNLNDLLAKEGITSMGDMHPATDNAATPHPPGHVISPRPVNDQGNQVDPNSIAL